MLTWMSSLTCREVQNSKLSNFSNLLKILKFLEFSFVARENAGRCAGYSTRRMAEQDVKLESLNNSQDEDLPYQELPMFDYASHGKSQYTKKTSPSSTNTIYYLWVIWLYLHPSLTFDVSTVSF